MAVISCPALSFSWLNSVAVQGGHMRTLIIALALVLASANPAAATLYRCEATGVADPLSTGSLKEPAVTPKPYSTLVSG